MMKKGLLLTTASLAMLLLCVMINSSAFAQQAIRVLYPDTATEWVPGKDYTVRWTGTSVGKGGVSAKATVVLVEQSSLKWVQHSGDVPNHGSYVFHVREDTPSGIYKIKVGTKVAGDTLAGDDSPWFKITAPQEGGLIPSETGKALIGQVVINQIDISKFPDVVLYVSAFDPDGKLVSGLQGKDFKVAEDEVDQSPLNLSSQLPAIAAALVVDTSGSMRLAMPAVRQAAGSFITNMRGQDQVLLLQFADKVNLVQPFTSDKATLQKAIRAMVSRGNTALYDAAFQATNTFGERGGRKAIVILTDGKDDDGYNRPLSRKTLKEVVGSASEINVPIYTIGLGTEVDAEILRTMAEGSGGRYFFSPSAAELEGLYHRIVSQLEGQYRLSYTTNITELDGSWHRVVVKARGSMGEKKYKSPAGASGQ